MKSILEMVVVLAVASIAQHAIAQNMTPAEMRKGVTPPGKGVTPPAATETLSSGVGIKHLKIGTGTSPGPTDTVKVHYRGTLADGKEFDSSHKRGQPATFPLDRVVPCWTQGLQKLKVGGKATLTCPPSTAYGARGIPNVIPPDSTLTFDVELLAIGG